MIKFHGVKEFKVKPEYVEVKLLTVNNTVVTLNMELKKYPTLREDLDDLSRTIMNLAVKILEA